MSLILGLHLTKKLYLVSDTRATIAYADGKKEYKDDLVKVFNLNSRIASLAAGDASPATFILKKISDILGEQGTLDDLKKILQSQLKDIASDFVNTTGKYGHVALIIAGYNPNKSKSIESSILGIAMSAETKSKEGQTVNQSIDPDILNPLLKAIQQNGTLEKGHIIELDNIVDSGLLSVIIDIRNNNITIKDVPCYSFALFYPDQEIKTIKIPDELISEIEFGYKKKGNWQDILYMDSSKLMSFVNTEIKKNNFETVGGNILIGIATPGSYFCYPTGDIGTIKDGKIVMLGSIFVDDKSKKLCYKLEDGTTGEYRFFSDIDGTKMELMYL